MFIHHVYFWLDPSAPPTARNKLVEDCRVLLGQIPTVRQIFVGVPAMTPRDVVDNSYDVGLAVVLDDAAGHDIYQEHVKHVEFLQRNKKHFLRVRVYDFVEHL